MKSYIYSSDVEIPLYRGKFMVCVSNSRKAVKSTFGFDDKELYAHTLKRNLGGVASYVVLFNFENKYRNITHGVVSHECLHAMNFLLEDRGFEPSRYNDEADAYLLEWMVDKVYEFFYELESKISI